MAKPTSAFEFHRNTLALSRHQRTCSGGDWRAVDQFLYEIGPPHRILLEPHLVVRQSTDPQAKIVRSSVAMKEETAESS